MAKFLDSTGLTVVWNKIKNNFVLNTKKASTSELGLIKDGDGVSVDSNGVLNLDKASSSALGGVKIGDNVNVAADGTISVAAPTVVPESLKNPNAITIGSKTYDGSTAVTVSASDLGLAEIYKPKGSKANLAEIEAITDKSPGDVWNALDTGMNYAWTGTEWDPLGGAIDIPLTQSEIETSTPLT